MATSITDRNLTAGVRLVATYEEVEYICRVQDEDGKLFFILEDGRTFKSPSSAGSAVMGAKAVNGWRFWNLVGEGPGLDRTPVSPADASTVLAKT